jgi:YbbR domain-containing protein
MIRMQIVRKNFGLKVLSLLLAIIGWGYFRFASNPIVAAARFDQRVSVPIMAVNLPMGYIAEYTDREALITIDSKPGEPATNADEIKAVLDLSNKGPGVYNVPVQLVAPDVPVASLSPASVTLTIERIEQRKFSVSVHYVGSQTQGIVVANQQLKPSTVTVEGPTSKLSQVASVRADVALPNKPASVDVMLRPIAQSALGQEVSGVQVGPDLIRARVEFVAGHAPQNNP